MEEEVIQKAVTEALQKAADLGIDDIKDQMRELNMNVSGKTATSLHTNLVSPTEIQIIAEQSILTLIFGRKPGKMPPPSELVDWVEFRGLPSGSEWGVAINIGKFGTQIFQGVREGIDIERTKQIMIDFFKTEVQTILGREIKDLLINLYR